MPPGPIAPMLATLTREHFSDPAWIYERKFDGQRVITERKGGDVRLLSRTGAGLAATYPEIAEAIAGQEPTDFVIDGEVVAFAGRATSFARLQQRMHRTGLPSGRAPVAVYYYVFDILRLDGRDVTRLPLRRRKRLLRDALEYRDPLRYAVHRNTEGERFLRDACARGWEGLIAKRADSLYVPSRSPDWLKFKCENRQEMVIGGLTDPKGSRERFGALLVGHYESGALRYAGKVGTGFDERTLASLGAALADRERATSPFADAKVPSKGVHWVRPELVCEVAFSEWTTDGRLRHPRFCGLRDDKRPTDVVRERPAAPKGRGR